MRTLSTAMILALTSASVQAQNYLCVADQSTGFSFEKSTGRWVSTNFDVSGQKWIVTKSKDPRLVYEVKKVGLPDGWIICKKDFSEAGTMNCSGLSEEFKINKKTLRYIKVNSWGFWSDQRSPSPDQEWLYKEGNSTPSIEIGFCSTF